MTYYMMPRHRCDIRPVCLGLLLVVLIEPAFAQSGATADPAREIPTGTLLIGLFCLPIVLLLNKFIATLWVRRGMYGISDEEQPDSRTQPDRPEVVAGRDLEFFEFSAETELPDVELYREAVVSQAAASLGYRWRITAAGALACALLPWALAAALGEPMGDVPLIVAVLSVFYIVAARFSYGSNRSEFYAYGHIGSALPDAAEIVISWLFKVWMKPGFNLLAFASYALLGTILASTGKDAAGPVFRYSLYAVLVAFAIALLHERWKPRESANIKLLVLRVFGSAKGARYTFDRLIAPWRYFGLHFTVDDPQFAAHRFRLFQRRSVALLILVIMAGAEDPRGSMIVLAAVLVWDWWGLFQRRPLKSAELARQRIESAIERPRNLSGLLKDTRMVCYMNTWRLVVEQFIDHADVVLFDLREFSEENAGSTYEINVLFDAFPLDSILFLRDERSDSEAIYGAIREQWRELREGSPNLNRQEPEALVYVSRKGDADDVQGLLDALLAVARRDVLANSTDPGSEAE